MNPASMLCSTEMLPTPSVSNGGTNAWLKVTGCFLIYINTYGVASAFGSYQDYYQSNSLRDYSASTISWIGTGQLFLLGFTGVISGPLYDRGFGMILLVTGCALQIFGLFMLSLSHTFWQILLSQGVCFGIGAGLVWVPAVSIVSNSFTSRRPIANGVAATGAACGGVIVPIMFRRISAAIGFDWINRVIGFFALFNSVIAIALLKPECRRQTVPSHKLFDMSALRDPSYVLFCAGLFFVELGYWIPPFLITTYAQNYLGASTDFAFYLLAIMNSGSLVGRIIPAFVAQVPFIGPAWTVVAGVVSLGVLVLSWLGIKTIIGLAIWCGIVGFMSGLVVSLPNAVIPRLSPSASIVGARAGMMSCFISLAALVGAPIAGALIGTASEDYTAGQVFSGVSILFGAALLIMPAMKISRKEPELRE